MKNKIGFMQGRLSPIYNNLIQSFPYTNWENEFKFAKKMGFSHIEWTVDQYLLDMNPISNKNGLDKIKKIKKKYNIQTHNLTEDFFMQNPFFKSDKLVTKILEDQILKLLENSSKIKVKNFVIPLVDNSSIKNTKQLNTVISFFKNIRNFLKKIKINIVFETDMKPKNNMIFIEKLQDDCFGINYDMGNSASIGYNTVKEINLYGSKIYNVHIKDRKFMGESIKLGKGNVNFDSVFECLKKNYYNGFFTLQTARSKSNKHIEVLNSSKKFILKYF